jgi:excinuclease ABC subunit C
MVPRITAIEAVACASSHEAAWLERNLLERAKPYWNRVRGGQEVPVYLRLDPHPRIIHMGQKSGDYGPYLGGNKVRLAVAALDRVLPVAYARERMTGSERDFARVLGVDPGSGDALRERVARVLRRDPDEVAALLDELARRRDAAAGELAFERAAAMQAEIEAIEWLTAPQRVTHDGAGIAALLGWADGVLVTFEVHAGRVDRWSIRTAAEPPPAVARTPSEWVAFVTAAAELASALLTSARSEGASPAARSRRSC